LRRWGANEACQPTPVGGRSRFLSDSEFRWAEGSNFHVVPLGLRWFCGLFAINILSLAGLTVASHFVARGALNPPATSFVYAEAREQPEELNRALHNCLVCSRRLQTSAP
jgi:hypothetical protein